MPATRARYYLSFLVIMLSIGANVGEHLLELLDVNGNYLLLTLVAVTVAGLLAHCHLLFILLVGGLTVAINLPAEMLTMNQISPTTLFATLVVLILMPSSMKFWARIS